MPLKTRISELIEEKSKRVGRKITQHEVATDAKIHPGTLSRYVNGYVGRLDSDVIERLCDYFGVEPGEIIIRVPRDK